MHSNLPGRRERSTQTLALLVAGDLLFGVPALAVAHVLQRPASLAKVPRAGGSLAGVFSFRGRATPVVDLGHWRGEGNCQPQDQALVAVLADGEQRLGVLIDSVRGLIHVPSEQIQTVYHDDDPNEFFHRVATVGGSGQLLSLLDPGRLMRRAQAWATAASAAGPEGKSEVESDEMLTTHTEPFAMLRLGAAWCGLPARAVAEVLPRPQLQPLWGNGSELLGVMKWRGHDVPVVDCLRHLGLEASSECAPWVAILQGPPVANGEPGAIGLACHGLDQVQRFDRRDVQPITGVGHLHAPACAAMLVTLDGSTLRLLDEQHLFGQFGMQMKQAVASNGVQDRRASAVPNQKAHVVFHARVRMATPIDQLQEIMPWPQEGGAAGTVNWRGNLLPLMDLQQRLWPGEPRQTQVNRILIAHVNGQLAGLLVGDVESIIPPNVGTVTSATLLGGAPFDIITVDQGGHRASYTVMDFSGPALTM